MKNWKTVITFTQPHEAHIAKGVLESVGIVSIVRDDLTAQVNNFYSNAIGGVKVDIKESDLDKGITTLRNAGYIIEDTSKDFRNIELVELTRNIDKTHCPFCKSDNISLKKEANLLTVIVYFILGVLFPIFKRSYVCYECNKEWKFKKNIK